MPWGRVAILLLTLAGSAVAATPDDATARRHAQNFEGWRQAAQAGDPKGMFNMGLYFDQGLVVREDPRQAMDWYKLAAARGVPAAYTNIGRLYELGRGVAVNHEEAFRWYRQAADRGCEIGMGNLALCYASGRGTRRDQDQARVWFDRAAAAGNPLKQKWDAEHPWNRHLLPRDKSLLVVMIGIVTVLVGGRMIRRDEKDTAPSAAGRWVGLAIAAVGIATMMYGAWSISSQFRL